MLVVFYVSGHGFGHASRQTEVIRALRARRPDVRVVVRTMVPPWFFTRSTSGPIEIQPLESDTGLTQIDSLRVAEEETVRQAARFYTGFDHRVAAEAALLRELRPSVVVSDVPPLASAAAAQAGIPSIAIANFTWDWMYGVYSQFDGLAPGCLELIREAYASTTLALRLPLGGGFETIPACRDIPFIARRARLPRETTRRLLGLREAETVVLASFGGHDFELDCEAIAERNDITIVAAPAEPRSAPTPGRRVRIIDTRELASHEMLYQDLVAAADVVVTKPGYGIVSECIANGVAMLYTSRGRVPEYDVMVAGMPRFLRCRFISNEDLISGKWREPIDQLLGSSSPPERADVGGAEVAVDEILST